MEEQQNDSLQTFVAVLIAIVTVIGALVAWRASVASDGAGDADLAGLRATLNVSETEALNTVTAYENYAAFNHYTRYNALGDEYFDALQSADEDEIETLDAGRANAYDIATAAELNFRREFIRPDETYDIKREIDELWADAGKEKDLNPDTHFGEADALRQQSTSLLATLMVLGVSLVFLTLVESASDRLRYVMVAFGLFFAVAGTISAIIIETGALR